MIDIEAARARIETIEPRDRESWLRIRGRDITASVVGALFDAHPWVSPFELWAMKTGRLKGVSEETAAMERGNLLEPVAVKVLQKRFPEWKITHNAGGRGLYYRVPGLRLGATPDVLVDAPGKGRGVVQIKSVEGNIFRKKWFEDGELEAPLWIALQASLEAYLTGAEWAAVGALVIGHGVDLHLIDIPVIPGVIAAMAARTADFFQMIAEGREPPADYGRDAGVIEAMYAQGDDAVEVDLSADNRIPELIAERAVQADALKAAKAAIEAIDAEVKAKMGTGTIAHVGGGRRITWLTQSKRGGFTPPSTFRVLRFPKERN